MARDTRHGEKRPGLSKSRIDRIGDRLREQDIDPETLATLDDYRRSFEPAYQEVVSRIEKELGLTPTGRPGKSVPSIIEKLKRESIRLSQIQDIAGCRIVVSDVPEQDAVAKSIVETFEDATIIDRRARPSHGYRAVHIVVRIARFPAEVQVRTLLQHLWAEYSEILSDLVDKGLKYGGGPKEFRENLTVASEMVASLEAIPAAAGSTEREALRLKLIELFGRFIPELERLRR